MCSQKCRQSAKLKSAHMVYVVPLKANIRNIKDVHGEFLTYVKNNNEIEIDLDSCEDGDLALIQLIEAARKTADADAKSISLTKPANTIVQATLRRSGFLDVFSCDDTKFWLHREVL
ncbi:MAG: hypothetical protein JWM58_4110 [Rhizobium sp.]|nr:hypothetical protein [Rhizobium sp.]